MEREGVKSPLDRLAAMKHARLVALTAMTSSITFALMILLKEGRGPMDSWIRGWLGGVYCMTFCFLFFRTEKK